MTDRTTADRRISRPPGRSRRSSRTRWRRRCRGSQIPDRGALALQSARGDRRQSSLAAGRPRSRLVDHRRPGRRLLHAAGDSRASRDGGGTSAGSRKGGSIFAISGVRGHAGGGTPGRGGGHGAPAQVRPRRPDPPQLRGEAGRTGRGPDRRLDPPGRPCAEPFDPAGGSRGTAPRCRSRSRRRVRGSASARVSPGSVTSRGRPASSTRARSP